MVMGSPMQLGKDDGPDDPEQDAERATRQTEDRRLDEELPTDEARGGAERLAQPDLPDPLGDRDQHDVHDADAAHQQGDRRRSPPSRMVSVRSTEVAVDSSDCSEVMVKSALAGSRDAVQRQQLVVGLLVGRGESRSRSGPATMMELSELREVPPKIRSAPVVMGTIT